MANDAWREAFKDESNKHNFKDAGGSPTDKSTAAGLAAPVGHGRYENAPPETAWLDDSRRMRLTQPFGYVDKDNQSWPVPVGAIVDGASIPQILWSLIGGPLDGLYRQASIIHDYYCDVRTRPWQAVHRVFYEAMLCSGVFEPKAKIMYYAVYSFGPRWAVGSPALIEGIDAAGAPKSIPKSLPVQSFHAASFEAAARQIFTENLSIESIEKLANLQ
ncbi:DUF1353 domain-containing protein [Chromobacterium alkanivorans]|uniref:DUF1353 domain-containing protein n=1 Tax=Chromobacterium alkanivorans TaxID=1071719 RepID=UPI00196897F8|nr:DUF1353 domain-containing protein [Chromobacterium alkanivorans]MBN3003455.1 DUF1353 domain-containing protein [Chromobacterium alkanivorans]